MVRRTIVWSPRAKEEFQSILAFYIERNGNANYSRWLFSEIQRRVKLLKKYPNLGHPGANDTARILPFMNYGIIYENTHDGLMILSIWDFRRNPDSRIDVK